MTNEIIAEIERLKPKLRKVGGEDATMTTEEVRAKFDLLISHIQDLQLEKKMKENYEQAKEDALLEFERVRSGWNPEILKHIDMCAKPWDEADLWTKECYSEKYGFDQESAKQGYVAGYQVRDRQLKNESVEGVIRGDNAKLWICNNPPSFIFDRFKDGDNVKLIILPKED